MPNMGAWGYDPVESDNGQEFYATTLRNLPEQIVKGLRSKHMAEPLAAAFLLERVGFEGVYPGDLEADLDLAIACLGALLADDEAAAWDNPERWRSVIRRYLGVLEVRRKDPRVPETQSLGEKVEGFLDIRSPGVKRTAATHEISAL